jgi:hypothetical protein
MYTVCKEINDYLFIYYLWPICILIKMLRIVLSRRPESGSGHEVQIQDLTGFGYARLLLLSQSNLFDSLLLILLKTIFHFPPFLISVRFKVRNKVCILFSS